jgi:hypothetical protein
MPDTFPRRVREATIAIRIREVAGELFDEDGYDDPKDNASSELFQLLCAVARQYTEAITEGEPTELDQAYTLVSVAENVCPSVDLHV